MNKKSNAFTLVELSIVMVIIGLLLTSILSAKQFINSARQRTAIKNIEEFRSATSAFNDKYLALPGDYSSANPNLGTDSPTNGNGDGVIAANANIFNGGNVLNFSQESLTFWRHLYQAKLMKQTISYNIASTECSPEGSNFNLAEVGFGRDACIVAYTSDNDGLNYFHIGMTSFSGIDIAAPNRTGLGLFPIDALAIDSKMDDGNGKAGGIRVVAHLSIDDLTPNVDCIDALTGLYRANLTTNYCHLRVRM